MNWQRLIVACQLVVSHCRQRHTARANWRSPGSHLRVMALILLTAGITSAQQTNWELEPETDSRLPMGGISVVEGSTDASGVEFILNNITIMNPLNVTLVSLNQPASLELLVYKEAPDKPLLQGTTGTDGSVSFSFRTDETVLLRVKGAEGNRYQMMLWVGPQIEMEPATTYVTMEEYRQTATANPANPANPASPGAVATGPSFLKWISILLGLILIALIVIIVLLFKGKKKSAGALLVLMTFGSSSLLGQPPPTSRDLKPAKASPAATTQQIQDQLKKLKEALDNLTKAGIKAEPKAIDPSKPAEEISVKPSDFIIKLPDNINNTVAATKMLLLFLEQFGLIDPREAAVQPNLNPPGQPSIPSRCYLDPNCSQCFADATAKLKKARGLLETQYVIYKQTELKAGRIIEMADAAASLSPYGKLLWNVQKDNPKEPMNQAREKFYATYDGNLVKLLNMVNEGLIAIGDCERVNYGEQDWHNRFGMPYYLFVRERYTRK